MPIGLYINKKKQHTKEYAAIKLICNILFLTFTFLYLYFYLTPYLAAIQHILSNGTTSYNSLIGAVLITVVLYLIHLLTASVTRWPISIYAVTFFPSLLTLALLGRIQILETGKVSLGAWIWIYPLLIIWFIGFVFLSRNLFAYISSMKNHQHFPRLIWLNMLQIAVMLTFVIMLTTHIDTQYYKHKIEYYISKEDYDKALECGKQSSEATASLTRLRFFALSKKDLLGEKLFEYPLSGNSSTLLSNADSLKTILFPHTTFYKHIGGIAKTEMPAIDYLSLVVKRKPDNKVAINYLLCAYLLDKDLKSFAATLSKHYEIDKNLPKHYREALILYSHISKQDNPILADSVMEADYKDYMNLSKTISNDIVRESKLRDVYGNTYWFYYRYND